MGAQLAAMQLAVQTKAEACSTEPPKNVLGNPLHAKAKSGNAVAPDKVVWSHLKFVVNSLLGTADNHGTPVRVTCVATGGYEDLISTWDTGTSTNQILTVAILEQVSPGDTSPAAYLAKNLAQADPVHPDGVVPDSVASEGSTQLVFDLNGILGTSDARDSVTHVGVSVRIWLSATSGVYEDVVSTWLPGIDPPPPGCTGTGANQATTGLLGQVTPTTTAASYLVDQLLGHGSIWDDTTTPPGSETPPRIEIDGIGTYLESVVIAKLNGLIDQYNQLLSDYNASRRPSTAAVVVKLTV